MIGRFISADTVEGNQKGMDPYAYVGGNPESFNDPSGNIPIAAILVNMIIGAVAGGLISMGAQMLGNHLEGRPIDQGIGDALLHGAFWGAIEGAIGPSGFVASVIFGAGQGAISAGMAKADENTKNGRPWEEGVLEAVIEGAIWGGLTAGALKGMSWAIKKFVMPHVKKLTSQLRQWITGKADDAPSDKLPTTCSFTPETVVATEQGSQPIGELQKGDQVWAYNEEAQKMELQPINQVWINIDHDLLNLTITTITPLENGEEKQTSEVINTNKEHPFLTTEEGFLPAGEVMVGMHILRADGTTGQVTRWEVVPGSQKMYNLEVAQVHTFTVGDGQWVVHNDCNKVLDELEAEGLQFDSAGHFKKRFTERPHDLTKDDVLSILRDGEHAYDSKENNYIVFAIVRGNFYRFAYSVGGVLVSFAKEGDRTKDIRKNWGKRFWPAWYYNKNWTNPFKK